MSRVAIQKQVVDYLVQHVGETIHVADLMGHLPPDANETSVRRCLTTDLTAKGFIIEPIVRGSVYRFKGYTQEVKLDTGKLFEQIGVAKDGRLVLQCDDGTIYLATEVG